jgi:uncharacterized protein YdbL (DUF1318 family)
MIRRILGHGSLTAILLIGLACVTINVYFPEAKIQDLSQRIEDEIAQRAVELEEGTGEDEAAPEGTADEDHPEVTPGRVSMLSLLLGGTPAYAQSVPEPGVSNPAIRAIIGARAARVKQINDFKSQGVIGESNQALLEARSVDSISDLRQRAALQKLIKDENADRERLYKEVAAAEGVELSQLPRIRQTYAETLRNNARAGDWIQLPDGNWKQK